MVKLLYLLMLLLLLTGCASTEDACDSVTCGDREVCHAGECILKDGLCDEQKDCDEGTYCDSSKKCVDETAYCTDLNCGEWQTCQADQGICVVTDGRCENGDHCAGDLVCNTETHLCESGVDLCDGITCGDHGSCSVVATVATCNCDEGYHVENMICVEDVDLCAEVSCDSWKSCNSENGLCELNTDRCDEKSDCGEGETCDGEHNCVDDPCADITCDSWKSCNSENSTCELKAGRCDLKSDCSGNKICDPNHYCINEADPCDGITCDGHGTCGVVEGNPVCTCDANYFNDGDLSCVNPCNIMRCEIDSVCQATSLSDATCVCPAGYHDKDYPGICIKKEATEKCEAQSCFVESGWFMMGCIPGSADCRNDNVNIHPVYLGAYQIDQFEVTVLEYKKCISEGVCLPKEHFRSDTTTNLAKASKPGSPYDGHPMNGVSWKGAEAYCKWVGKQLPTEAQWEKAARGVDRRKYPWGAEEDICGLAATCGLPETRPAGSFDNRSPYGVADMSGNVVEWVQDIYNETFYTKDPVKEPLSKDGTGNYVVRGGSYLDIAKDVVTTYYRYYATGSKDGLRYGFRCVTVK